jgi:isopentenyl-diphosphate delta-isomerase
MDYCYKTMEEVEACLLSHPENHTAWFHIAFPKIKEWRERTGIDVA